MPTRLPVTKPELPLSSHLGHFVRPSRFLQNIPPEPTASFRRRTGLDITEFRDVIHLRPLSSLRTSAARDLIDRGASFLCGWHRFRVSLSRYNPHGGRKTDQPLSADKWTSTNAAKDRQVFFRNFQEDSIGTSNSLTDRDEVGALAVYPIFSWRVNKSLKQA